MNRKINILTLADGGTFAAPFEEDYALLLVISPDSNANGRRDQIASDIARSSCQYALTFGRECEEWHDAIDWACLDEGMPEGRFLMTTWHDDEPIEDVIDFLWWNTTYDDFSAERLAIIQLGPDLTFKKAIRERMDFHYKLQAEQDGGGQPAARSKSKWLR